MSALLALSLLAHAGGATVPVGDDGEVRIGLTAQLRAEGRVDAKGETDLSVRMHRLRPTLKARLHDDQVRLGLQLNTTPGALEVLDVWADVAVAEGWRVRAGQLKAPFTTYRARSFSSMLLTDWAVTTRAFGSERQWGVHLLGEAAGLSWTGAVTAGPNQRSAHGVRLAELYGGPGANPSSLIDPGPVTDRVHPEVFLHVARYGEGLDPRAGRDTSTDGRWHAGTALSLSLDARPVRGEDLAARIGVDGIVQGHGLGLSGVLTSAMVPTADGWRPGMHGGLGEIAVRLAPRVEVAGRVAGTATTRALRDDVRAVDPDAEPWRLEAEAGVGLNLFLAPSLTVQSDVRGQRRALDAGPRDALVARLQVQAML